MVAPIAMDERSVRRVFRLAGWLFIITIAVLSLSPEPLIVGSELGAPKLGHLLAYLVTAAALCLGYPHSWSRVVVCAFLVGFGGLMEIAQAMIPGRTGAMADVLINALGVAIGLSMAMLVERLVRPAAWR